LTAKDLEMMMPFRGSVQETVVVDQQPTMQEKLQSEVNLAAGALTAASKPGFKPVPKEEADKALFGKAKVAPEDLDLNRGTRETILSDLTKKYGNLGVRFEIEPSKTQKALGLGDIRAIADDGSSITIQTTDNERMAKQEADKLQSFLMGKSAGVEKKPITPMEFLMMSRDGISPQEEGKFKRVYSQEMVDNSIKFANDELNNTKKAVDDINKEVVQLNEEAKKISEIVAVSGVTPDIEETYNSITQRYQDLQARADERVKYAKSIGALADEGVKKAVGENTRLLSYNGNIPSALYNSLLKGAKDLVGGAMAALPELADIATLGASESFYGDKAQAKENSEKLLNEIYDNLKAEGVSKEYATEGNMAWKALFSVPEFIPSLLVPGGATARVTAMTTQGIGRRYEEMNSNPETKNLPEEEKFFMAAGPALVEAKLENFGLTQWLGANKGLASSIFINALSKVAPKAGVKGLNKIINAEISNLALRGAANTAGAMISEFETGALQNISDTAFRDAYEIAKGKDLFKQPGFGDKDFGKALLEDAMLEGLGGMWMAGAVNIAQQTSNYATGKSNTNETFRLVKQILADETTSKSLIATLKAQIMDGKLSKEQAINTINNFKEARAIAMELPQDLSEDNQRKAFDLIAEKRKLTKQIEGKDPSLVDKQKTRITAIDQELKNISNAVQEQTTSEVPVQPGAAVSGEVAQGEPQAEPQVVTEEGQAQEEVIPGSKGVISGIEITYPTQEQRAEREAVRNSQDYVSARSIELPVTDTEALAEDLKGEFAMVTGENPDGQPLTEEENQALNQKAEEWLTSRGYDPKPIVGKFNQAENSFFVKGMTEADAIEFAQEFNQKSVAHSGGMLYQDGSRNPRTTGDDFSFGKFEPGMDMVSIVNTTDGPRQFSVAYDFKTTIESDAVSEFDQAVNNSAQSLKLVAPDLKIIVAENTEDAQLQIAEALSAVAPSQAADVAEGFTTETRGQTVFVNGKPFAIVLDKSQADSKTVGHEAWETMLNDAFGDDQAKFKEFRDEIDRQLRLNGYGEIADALTKFSNQRGYEDVKYSEYMAELGGMLVANGFKQGSLDAKQKSLLEKIGDVINKFAQLFTGKKQFLDEATPEDILGFMITISNKVAKGEDVSQFFRGEKSAAKEGVTSKSQIDQRLSESGIEVPKNEKLSAKINPSKEGDVMKQIDALLDKYPNALKDRNQWKELMSRVFSYKGPNGEVMIPKFPEALSRMSNSVDEVLKELSKVSDKQRELASSGLEGTKEIGKLYKEGKMDETDTGLYFLWNIMSIGISPYPQEAGFLRAVENGVDSFIRKSAEGKFLSGKEVEYNGEKIDSGLADYYDWVDQTLPKGVAGSGSKANLRSFGSAFLSKASTKIETGEFKGLTKMEALHKILSDRTTPTNELRRKWLSNLSGMSFNNKIFDFILLTTGRSDLFVIDRVRTEHFWDSDKLKKDSGLKPTTSIYDGSELSFGKTTGAGYSKMLSDVPGLVFAELANRTMQPVVKEAYKRIGVKDSPDVGRFHWETWVAASSQEVSHGSIDAIVQRKASGEITDAGIRQGKYGAWDFNFAYRKRAGKPFMYEFTDEDGNVYEFDDIAPVYEEISNQNQKKNYGKDSDRFILKDENGNIIKRKTEKIDNAWYDQPGVDKQKYFDYLKSQAKEVIPAPNVVEDQGVVIEKPTVTTRSQKSIEDVAKQYPNSELAKQEGNEIGLSEITVDGDVVYIQAIEYPNMATAKPVIAWNSKGENIAFATFRQNKDGDWYSMQSETNKSLQRKGIMNAIYDLAEKAIGKIVQSKEQSVEAKSFWDKRKSKSKKSVPAVVDEVLTDDGKGNYVFVHYSDELRDTIKPMSGSNKNFTSREEVAAISSVGGVAMYYTKQGQKEQGVGNVPHTVLVPKDKVYFYGTTERGKVSNDPENFEPEARRRFQEYKNRGNESRPTEYAFDSNNAAAWVGKVASENGYDMLVTNWGAPTSYRAQTVKELTPEADYTGFKEIPEPTYEVGDEVFLYGKYVTLTDVKPDVLSYEYEGGSGKYPLTVMTRDKIIMVQKAKPTVTTKSQKIVVNTIPGYERMMGEVEGILDKTMNSRDGSYNRATASAIGYIQKSKVYINADDSQREQIIRDFVKLRGEKFKVAPSVGKILGQIKDVKKVTVNEKTALKDQIKLEAKAARDAAAFVKQLRMQISGRLKMMAGRGVISAKQASTILARYDRMNILNPDMRDRFVDYMANVFQSAEYADKVKEATKLRKTIRKAAKNPDNQAENSKMAKSFAEIDPSRVENIDDYLNNAEQMLKAVSRKTGDVKMRSLVNMTDMFSYVNKEIQAQREQIKNEILSKYQDLVDAGVLDSKMTINEIQKVVEAIEEKKDESEAKAKEAKEAVKQMMDELSPILLQIARTGEDPFTGDPIDLTPDEKRDLVKLAKMDLDSLSLADALKAVEYANNFISNGIFSGIGAIVSINEGSLEPARLKKEGVMSLRLRKYFSPGAGRKWAEQLGTLTMLNKLLFVSNEKAIMVANASGESGIANGKAKAIKIVEKAVKEYTDKFSSLKDFRTGENIIERGILAFVSRTVIGDKFQVQKEFNRRKRLVEETIQALTDPNNSTDADIKKGELIEKVYDKILKDAKNVNDVRAKVSEVNKKAVDWWVNEWSKHYDRMDEVSRSVYNTLLTRDANFTPDRFQSIDLTTASENDFDSSFFSSFENVSTEKSGSLKENKGIENLPSDKNGVKTRIVNLDFDMNNANALTNALIDVETASSVLKAKGFVTSKDFGKIFSSKDDAKLYKRRLIAYANNVRGKNYVDQNELTNMGKALNAIGSFGTAKALFKLSQPLNQSIPPLFNTLVQTGRLDLGTLFSGGNAFIDRTGYPIINRGFSSLADLQAINKKIAEAEKNLLAKGIMGIAEYNNKMLELWLQKPDVFTARSSWLSFYINSLKKQGIDTRGIDWNTHEVNKKAADYAELMVSSQQNVNDSDMQGMLLTDKSSYAKAVRKALFTLMTFTLNQKTRIWSDMRTLSNKKLTSEADRKEALLSLSGAIVELVSFHSISLSVSYIVLRPLIDAMMEALGYEDDEDKELEKKKLLMNKSASIAQSFLKDFILPPMPIVGSYASGKVNEMMDEYGVSEKIAVEGFGIEDGESKFKLYDKEDYSFIDALGPVGIAAEKGKELFDFSALASTGKFDVETRGGLITKKILEENEDLAKINASIMSAYYLGILPGELAYIARKLDKKIKKGAEKVEEEED
jgi:hypothetical protein